MYGKCYGGSAGNTAFKIQTAHVHVRSSRFFWTFSTANVVTKMGFSALRRYMRLKAAVSMAAKNSCNCHSNGSWNALHRAVPLEIIYARVKFQSALKGLKYNFKNCVRFVWYNSYYALVLTSTSLRSKRSHSDATTCNSTCLQIAQVMPWWYYLHCCQGRLVVLSGLRQPQPVNGHPTLATSFIFFLTDSPTQRINIAQEVKFQVSICSVSVIVEQLCGGPNFFAF